MKFLSYLYVFLLVAASQPCGAKTKKLGDKEPDYTKGEELPIRENIVRDSVNCGPIGVMAQCWSEGNNAAPTEDTRTLKIWEVQEGSPAEGKLKPGDVMIGVISPKIPPLRHYNWVPPTEQPPAAGDYLDATEFPYDVRKALSAAITEAEKKENGGKLVLNVWRDGKTMPVELNLPVLGSYSSTTPFNCEKSERLITLIADQIVERGIAGGIQGSLDGLGLLATGERKYIKVLHDYVRKEAIFDPKKTKVPREASGWYASYELIFTAEYYMATKDRYVLPALNRMAMTVALGQSHAGTWSHGMANPGLNYGRDHGMTASYGSMNSVTGSCATGLVLAQKAGVGNKEIDEAVRKSLDFLAYFSERGTIPYGDHTPWMGSNESNGKNSQCAVLFDLAGRKDEAKYFNKMTLASHRYREGGHTGHYWNFIWGHIGAARGGDEAAQAFAANLNWFRELERRSNYDYLTQPQLYHGHWRTPFWKTAGVQLLGLCIPRKEIHLTGKGGNCFEPLVGEELRKAIETEYPWPSEKDSAEDLLVSLASFSPIVREFAAQALGQRDENVVDDLIEMLMRDGNPDARRGAAMGLCYAGRGSKKAVEALIKTLETTEDQVLKHFVVRAFQSPNVGNGLASSDAILKSIPVLFKQATIEDPKDPWRKLHAEIATTLFDGSDALAYDRRKDKAKNLELVDTEILIKALELWLSNINGYARGRASQILATLDDKTLEPLWGDIFLASLVPSPSGVMGHQQVMTNGVKLMAERNIREGLVLAAIQCRRPGWGQETRISDMAKIIPRFGDDSEPFLKEYVTWLESNIPEDPRKIRKNQQGSVNKYKRLLELANKPKDNKRLSSITGYLDKGDIELARKMYNFYPVMTGLWNKNRSKWDIYIEKSLGE